MYTQYVACNFLKSEQLWQAYLFMSSMYRYEYIYMHIYVYELISRYRLPLNYVNH